MSKDLGLTNDWLRKMERNESIQEADRNDIKLQWTVKGVDTQTRELSREAAKKSGMMLGMWVESALKTAAEKQLRGNLQPSSIEAEILAALKLQTESIKTIEQDLKLMERDIRTLQRGVLEKLVK